MFFKKKRKVAGEETANMENVMSKEINLEGINLVNGSKVWKIDFHGKPLIVEQGALAKQADGAVLVRYGDSTIIGVAQGSRTPSRMGFFPLQVIMQEKMYAAGKIPGGFNKREGRPSEWATLTSRLIDRPLRPLFPEGFINEVQVIDYTLSNDDSAPIETAAMFASALALGVSPIPFNGPAASVYVGLINGEFVINPSRELWDESKLLVNVAGTKKAINMVEAEANEVDEDTMSDAIIFGHKAVIELCEFQEKIIAEVGCEKFDYEVETLNEEIYAEVKERFYDDILNTGHIFTKQEKYAAMDKIKTNVKDIFEGRAYETEEDKNFNVSQAIMAVDKIQKDTVRKLITVDKVRPDGRSTREVRNLDSQIDIIPNVHGNAMFTRGETQAMSFITLGALNENQLLDGATISGEKHFMHHYNFPQFSVGSTGRYIGASRREIGHGALGERALMKVMPSTVEFPYTVRAVSEILESNGSTSQASICATSMALMAAGVPVKAAIAGCAMGLIKEGEHYSVLTDIQGLEDHLGDMDFKVAGTEKGICAIQMDIKIDGITYDILREAIREAKAGRLEILENMNSAISTARPDVAPTAPKMGTMIIPVDKIKVVIGKGGEMIDKIIAECNDVKIDISDEGQVIVYHTDREAINKAMSWIEKLTKVYKVGDVVSCEVVEIRDKFCFVKFDGDKQALLHISNISNERIADINTAVKVGDVFDAKISKIEPTGKMQVSKKDI